MTNGQDKNDRRWDIADLLDPNLGQDIRPQDVDAGSQMNGAKGTPVQVGAEIDGFIIREELDRGGMGVVYKAHHPRLNRFVAIKVLRDLLEQDSDASILLFKEATFAARFEHPGIVRIHDIDKRNPPRYLVMEYVDGPSLQKKVVRSGPLAPEHAVQVAMAVAGSLAAAHAEGILHRDIKPGNVLLDESKGRVLITDFGIAHDCNLQVDGRTQADTGPAGTLDYMSPEQKHLRKLDERTDVFSLGMTLYFALTSRTAVPESRLLASLSPFPESGFLPPSTFNRDVSNELDRVVLRMIHPNKEHRYRDCRVVIKELGRVRRRARRPSHPVVAAWRRVTGTRMTRVLWVLLVAMCATSVVVSLARHAVDTQHWPARVTVDRVKGEDRSTVTALDRRNEKLWSVTVGGVIGPTVIAQSSKDQPPRVIIGISGGGSDRGKVIAYDSLGNVSWATRLPVDGPYGKAPDADIIGMDVQQVLVADLWQDGVMHVVVVATESWQQQTLIAVLGRNGSVEKTYWNPGLMRGVTVFKPAGAKSLRILAWGVNDKTKHVLSQAETGRCFGAIVCLDPETMSGEAPPRKGTIGAGAELWYGLLLHQNGGPSPLSRMLSEVTASEPGTAPEAHDAPLIKAVLRDGSVLHVDQNGGIVQGLHGGMESASDVTLRVVRGEGG